MTLLLLLNMSCLIQPPCPGDIIVFISDNACAVAMATNPYSGSTAIEGVAAQLRELLSKNRAACTAVHLPGKFILITCQLWPPSSGKPYAA
jgi:hypothetical protein